MKTAKQNSFICVKLTSSIHSVQLSNYVQTLMQIISGRNYVTYHEQFTFLKKQGANLAVGWKIDIAQHCAFMSVT